VICNAGKAAFAPESGFACSGNNKTGGAAPFLSIIQCCPQGFYMRFELRAHLIFKKFKN
jgi:hypothetical protein